MPFGLNLNSGGDFLRVVKFDARAGRLFRVDRDEDGEQQQTDITDGFECVLDLAGAEYGWAHFQPGVAPDFAVVPIGEDLPPQPSKNHRQAVRMRLLLPAKIADGTERLRELAVTSKSAIRGLEQLWDLWTAQRGQHPGKAALVRLAGVKPVSSGGGAQRSTNYEPQFAIAKWVKTPEEFETPPERPAAATNGSAAADAYRSAKGGAKPPAVPAKAPPPPAEDDVDEWG